jgi:tetratricopeptide (TPR) repeat protein
MYRFGHNLFQKYLYNNLDEVEQAYLHEGVGNALEALYGDQAEAVAVQLARHFQEAGIAEKAIVYLLQAGERARRQYANAEALEHFRRALTLLETAVLDETRQDWRVEIGSQLLESLGDVLELTGQHDEARVAYQRALIQVPGHDLIWQSRLQRKTGKTWEGQHQYAEALQAYTLAETTLGQEPAESAPQWWQEWVQIQLERTWAHYWQGQWHEISELADNARPTVEQHGTPTQRINFLISLVGMNCRQDRYVVSEETLSLCQDALAISQEPGNLSEITWARFWLGFCHLWRGELGEAEEQMEAALALAERTGDVVLQSRCLTYLTIVCRKRGQVEETRHSIARSLAAATVVQMPYYIGMAKANLTWVAWREGNLSEVEANGRAALELWQQTPVVYPFQWAALWPLIGVRLAQGQIPAAIDYACSLLAPTQQRLPDALSAVVEEAIRAWEEGEPETAHTYLNQATELAQEMGYL